MKIKEIKYILQKLTELIPPPQDCSHSILIPAEHTELGINIVIKVNKEIKFFIFMIGEEEEANDLLIEQIANKMKEAKEIEESQPNEQ